MRKTRCVAFGETIIAKPLNLVETAGGKLLVIAACHHPAHHLLLQQANRALGAEGRHGLAQLICLRRAELGGINGHLHRLLLKDRHA